MRKLPRKMREIIGTAVGVGGCLAQWWLMDGDESMMLLGSTPFVAFFMWLCPELWQGK